MPKADNSGSNLHLSSHRWSWFFFVGIIPTFLAMLTLHHAVRLHAAELKTHGDRMFAGYFKQETAKLKERCLADTRSIEDWRAKKEVYRAQLFEMLSLSPLPPRTPLQATVTGRVMHQEFEVWNLHFQSMPGLYVTGNLYVPKGLEEPAPTILYVCGHGRVKINGVSFGNKVHYRHHGIWFARNGYVCLTIDTLQLGEIEGLHHGTYRENMWWWNSRGYSPAGVEAWNCIRALDYLDSLEFVDRQRIGVTGRSGGGAYSWWITALDERIRAAAPVAGITDLENHVVDGVVEGHCDCMYTVNTHRWDFAQIAALAAPRPLLILNTDDDGIFPLDGVVRLFKQVRRIYEFHDAKKNLGLVVTPGGHRDTQELRLPVFNWFNRHLKGEESPIAMTAPKLLEPQQLKVFRELPTDQHNTTIHNTFTRISIESDPLKPRPMRAALLKKSFGGWPQEPGGLRLKMVFESEYEGVRLAGYDFDSQPGVRLRMYLVYRSGLDNPERIHFHVPGAGEWRKILLRFRPVFAEVLKDELQRAGIPADSPVDETSRERLALELDRLRDRSGIHVTFLPRGLGLTALTQDERHLIQVRRRFMLLGQTLDGMRVWDLRRSIRALRRVKGCESAPLELWGEGAAASLVTLAALFEKGIDQLNLKNYPRNDREQPDFLNISRIATPIQILELARRKAKVQILDP